MLLLILFAFIAGFVTILSPCILPVLPIILSGSVSGGHRRPLGIVLGFIFSFTFFTLFLSLIVRSTGLSSDFLRTVSVIIILLFGVGLLLPQFQHLLEKLFSIIAQITPKQNNKTGLLGGILIGLSLGLIWTPCVGPILASIITLAATSTVTTSAVLITLAYSLGTAIPMLAVAYGGRSLLQRVPWLTRNTAKIQKGFGIVMIVVAAGIFFNIDRQFQTYILEKFPQYGTGLTSFEDNDAVQKELEELDKLKQSQNVLENVINSARPTAPEIIPGGQWYNSQPLTIESLREKVVLIDFWTYTCINCIRTLPYLRTWNDKYSEKGLVIIGVHTPEFEFEKDPDNVAEAISDFELTYPIVQDNDYATWQAYNNRYWPAKYLVDKNGKIRYTHFGEGAYDETEQKIRELLSETGASVSEINIDNPSYTIDTQTPEIYLGYGRMEHFVSEGGIRKDTEYTYEAPSSLNNNEIAFEGNWKSGYEFSMPQKGSSLLLNFTAKDVHIVARPLSGNGKIRISLDSKAVSFKQSGEDVLQSIITIDQAREYHLLNLPQSGNHILRIDFLDNNVEVYAFTFG